MTLLTAPALLLGLGARILLDQLTRVADEPSMQTAILPGAWQGVALSYAGKEHNLTLPVACAIAAKLYLEFAFFQDTTRSIISLLGIVLGYFAADLLAAYFDAPKPKKSSSSKRPSVPAPAPAPAPVHATLDRVRERDRERSSHHSSSHRRRTSDRDTRSSRKSHSSRQTTASRQTTTTDITDVNTDSEMVGPKGTMSQVDRQVAALRARASLADSERRRFKEEKKWAVAQGNMELAAELSWQYKRYSTLMKSFHREADTKLLQAQVNGVHKVGVNRTRLDDIDEVASPVSERSRDIPIVGLDVVQ